MWTSLRPRPLSRLISVRRLSLTFAGLLFAAFVLYTRNASLAGHAENKQYELLSQVFENILTGGEAQGGKWYIPPSWTSNLTHLPKTINPNPTTILDAVRLASDLSTLNKNRQIPNTNIPLIVHQTYKTTNVQKWSNNVIECVSGWVAMAIDWHSRTHHRTGASAEAAYFMWNDKGMEEAVNYIWPDSYPLYQSLPVPVLKADTFRVFTVHSFGGIYADADTRPLRHPASWVGLSDLTPWMDEKTGKTFTPAREVGLIVGVECDTPEGGDQFWRMGYAHSVELTNWAFAGRKGHPALKDMLESVAGKGDAWDPLEVTGPYRLTDVIAEYVRKIDGDVRWAAFSGLHDGGRSKAVGDVLVLPITGFSPGRSSGYGNMGSKPTTHHDARLVHMASGSWKHFDLAVELRKLCRTVFAMCKADINVRE
ncbi:hypothetical protein HK097_005331 [Rhizophlyctis rosea]|uniref:Glycosyltransferase family 32 protein n=1 Tax=Rhizophlyctis rosea TaxID=64517 RepID=A0AAD5SKZ0_9FUNG|nr:hypothetical protein HK097_005331 [Rhizophlyctis rosea]